MYIPSLKTEYDYINWREKKKKKKKHQLKGNIERS